MEFGKTEKINLSEVRIGRIKSPFATRIIDLMPGEGFVASGVEERGAIQHPITHLHRTTKMRFSVNRAGPQAYRIVRTA